MNLHPRARNQRSLDTRSVERTASFGARLDDECVTSLRAAVQRYLDLMYDCDVSRFDDVFAPAVQLHGFRDGAMRCWTAEFDRNILAKRLSPKSLGAPREQSSVTAWRNVMEHRRVREKSRNTVFDDDRIHVACVTRRYTKRGRGEAPNDSVATSG